MADGDEDQRQYRWEGDYEKTWEAIREDDDGLLDKSIHERIRRAKRLKLMQQHEVIRLGVMRHLYIILDLSESMLDQDLKPNRQRCAIKLIEKFVEEFFDQNPISQLGIIVTRNKRAEKISDLGGNSKVHLDALKKALDMPCLDEPSLVNSLELAIQGLKNMPSHTSRETLIILGSLTSCDPGNIQATLKSLKSNNIRCSVIGLAAEVHVCRMLSKQTGGTYSIILDDSHFQELLLENVIPPPSLSASASSLIRMGFPHSRGPQDKEGKPSFCMCHLDTSSGTHKISTQGYYCPQCQSKYCELPVECKACGLTLVSAPHLARSYHYFFRLEGFREVAAKDFDTNDEPLLCRGCNSKIADTTIYQCPKCQWLYCIDCDVFLHDTLHTCPGCSSTPSTLRQEFGVG